MRTAIATFLALSLGLAGLAQKMPMLKPLTPVLIVQHRPAHPPVQAGRVAVYEASNGLTAFDLNSRKILWRKPKTEFVLFTAWQQNVFTVDDKGGVNAFEAVSGKRRWRIQSLSKPMLLSATSETVVLVSAAPNPYARDAEGIAAGSGKRLWRSTVRHLAASDSSTVRTGDGYLKYTDFNPSASGPPTQFLLDAKSGAELEADDGRAAYYTQRTQAGTEFISLALGRAFVPDFNDPSLYEVNIVIQPVTGSTTARQNFGRFTLGPRAGCDAAKVAPNLGFVTPVFLGADERFVWLLVGDLCGNRIARLERKTKTLTYSDLPETLALERRLALSQSDPAFKARRAYGLVTGTPSVAQRLEILRQDPVLAQFEFEHQFVRGLSFGDAGTRLLETVRGGDRFYARFETGELRVLSARDGRVLNRYSFVSPVLKGQMSDWRVSLDGIVRVSGARSATEIVTTLFFVTR